MIGQEVFGYRVEELIGCGSFASVYKVKKENESGTYIRALKHIIIPTQDQYQKIWNAMGKDKVKTDQYFEQIFQETMQEIQLMHAFTDNGVQNIVSCYENDVIHQENPKRYEIFILMEYLTTLSDYFSKNDLIVEDILNLGIQILDALEVCHRNNIIHRDIKEDNIFITSNGISKLGDFGVAKILQANDLVTSMKGTAGYMAPEVLRNTEEYDKTVDLYSLGMVLYRLLNHMRSPFFPPYPSCFDIQDEQRALRRRMNGEPIPLPDAVSESLGKVILKALASRDVRYKSAEEFRRELIRVKDSMSQEEKKRSVMTGKIVDCVHIGSSTGTVKNPEKQKNRKWKRFINITVLLVILLLGSIIYKQSDQRKVAAMQAEWEKEKVVPFECISMEMTEEDFKKYYGSRFSSGVDNQYYLKIDGEVKEEYATLCFEEGKLESVSYSLEMKEDEWDRICKEFYRNWIWINDEWPYIVNMDSVQAILDYDNISNRAHLFVNRIS